MKNTHFIWVLWIYAAVLGVLFFGCRQPPPDVVLANRLVSERMTSGSDSAEINHLLDTLTSGTAWQGKVQINRLYKPNIINIYLVDGGTAFISEDNRGAAKLKGNCFYAGQGIIFIDDAYLRAFLARHGVRADPQNIYLLDDHACFLYWAIGHELGHLVCGHLSGHFDAGSLDHFVKSSSMDNRQELQADSFFVHAIVRRNKLRISEERLMMNMLNSEISQKIGPVQTMGVGLIYDYTNAHIVSYARQPTHPEYVIRLSRMLDLSSKFSGNIGLQNMVAGFIKQLKETPQKQSFK